MGLAKDREAIYRDAMSSSGFIETNDDDNEIRFVIYLVGACLNVAITDKQMDICEGNKWWRYSLALGRRKCLGRRYVLVIRPSSHIPQSSHRSKSKMK